MAAMDSRVPSICPGCGAEVRVSRDIFENLRHAEGDFHQDRVGHVTRAVCGCWVRRLSPDRLVRLLIGLLAA